MSETNIRHRILVLRIIAALAMLALIGRLGWMQLMKGDAFLKKAEDNMIRSIPVPAERGIIIDRTGKILARNSPRFTISLLSFELRNQSAAITEISRRLSLTAKETRELLRRIQANAAEPIRLEKAVDYRDLSRLAEIQADYPGIYIESLPIREYPLRECACHIAGYLGEISIEELESLSHRGYQIGDMIGKNGLEKYYDREMKGESGARKMMVNVEGRMSHFAGEDPPHTGAMLVLNLDSDLQKVCEESLRRTIRNVQRKNGEPSGGAVVVLSASSGEVLSLVSLPGFDPNLFSKGISSKDYARLINDKASPLLDRTVHCAYPCASTFKMFTSAAALQEGIITRNSGFYCAGVYDVGGTPFNCFVRSGHGPISFNDAIAHSCDVVFYMLAVKLNLDKFLGYCRSFGIGTATGIDLPGEDNGLLPTPEWKEKVYHQQWYAGDTVNLSIGQGFLGVTPLQLAAATAAVANGGSLYSPRLVRQIISAEGKVLKENIPQKIRQVPVDPVNLEAIRQGMRGAVRYGTATAANTPVVEIAGKTGTAENFPTIDNPHGRNHTWFTSFAPYNNPEIIVTVFIEKSGGFGGEWCAPVARDVAEAYFQRKKSTKREK